MLKQYGRSGVRNTEVLPQTLAPSFPQNSKQAVNSDGVGSKAQIIQRWNMRPLHALPLLPICQAVSGPATNQQDLHLFPLGRVVLGLPLLELPLLLSPRSRLGRILRRQQSARRLVLRERLPARLLNIASVEVLVGLLDPNTAVYDLKKC